MYIVKADENQVEKIEDMSKDTYVYAILESDESIRKDSKL